MIKRRGQSLLEFVLVLPILLLFVSMLLDLGRLVFYKSSLTNAVREGARYGIVHPCDASATNDVVQTFSFGYTPDLVTISSLNDDTQISVLATYTFFPVTPFSQLIVGNGGVTLQSQSIMDFENFDCP
jgi:Flp pilus assembly protein TadG